MTRWWQVIISSAPLIKGDLSVIFAQKYELDKVRYVALVIPNVKTLTWKVKSQWLLVLVHH